MDTDNGAFTFVDLFAGIGGIRLGLEANGGECVYSVEWDRFACTTYRAHFHHGPDDDERLWEGDIRDVVGLPAHDLLAAGFPCQPFSIAGVSKKRSLGRPHGFLDLTQGTLFFEVARLAERSGTPILLLESRRCARPGARSGRRCARSRCSRPRRRPAPA